MEDESQGGFCGGNWWNSLKNLFFCSSEVNDLGSLDWPLNPHNLIMDTKTGRSIDSTFQMRRISLSSSTTYNKDWNQDLLPDSGRSEENYSNKNWSTMNLSEDSSFNSLKKVNQVFPIEKKPSNSLTSLPQNSASYSYNLSLLQNLFDTEYSQPQQSLLLDNQQQNYSSSPNYQLKSTEILPSFTNEPALKQPRTGAPSPLPTLKVRKVKMGDRITALHQLVAPFGKRDTASVLHETIGYIKFLHGQISVLSTSTQGFENGYPSLQPQLAADEIKNGERLTDDLKSRGLYLVPISSTGSLTALPMF